MRIDRPDDGNPFAPEPARVLRVLLCGPGEYWSLPWLAREAGASQATVERVLEALRGREWLEAGPGGVRLIRPEALLRDWASRSDFRRWRRRDYGVPGRPPEVEEALAEQCARVGAPCALTGFSGAARLAPYVRYQRVHAYVCGDRDEIARALGARETPGGANLTLIEPEDDGVFYRAGERDGIRFAAPVQLYVDLSGLPGRGAEAAQFLLEQVIRRAWTPAGITRKRR